MSNGTEYARRVTALNDLAGKILAAKAAGDLATVTRLQAQFRVLLGESNLAALAEQAKAQDMPSDFLLRLAGIGDWLSSVRIWLLVAAAVAALLLLRRGR